ncbi:MAG TPA: hypothetical protein VGS05_03380 [Candidatus Sulfotelmatobacter sp.]|nr:hypothetical protein [Candidatus Sulfotelmatobacter sp.]
MEKTIYMPLVGDGTECWRPVRAVQVGDDIFEISDKLPENESWAFSPHCRVRCRDKVFADGHAGMVVFAYAIENHPYYRLLKDHQGRVFRIVLSDGEEAVGKVSHVDEEHEDFILHLLSTNLEHKYSHTLKEAIYAVKFTELVSARLEE